MVRRYDFVDKTLFLIRKLLEENLPAEDTLDEMIRRRDILLKKLMK